MNVVAALRLNMTNVHDPLAGHRARYRAALDMAEYADRCGFAVVNCEEHHGSGTGWLPAPLLLAAAVAARTQHLRISIGALLVPLYDPVRLAEDLAVLDNLCGGRLTVVAGIGYRPEEYAALGRDFTRRGRLMDEALELMFAAWRDEPIQRGGQPFTVTPKPFTTPHPQLMLAGMSAAAARRAARFGLPLSLPMAMPEVEAVYQEELIRCGTAGFVHKPEPGSKLTLLHEDPDAAWHRYGPHILTEVHEYASWRRDEVPRPHDRAPDSVDELRAHSYLEILTPGELRDQIAGGRTEVLMNLLIGGLPIEAGWESLRLLGDGVLARVGLAPAPIA
ncbi:LLM class flavin-dependent oxidoreductase [Nocardia seriolae]|uniref:Limonene 1,2-monooxygenase n=1 Tax=Nocardia seriolae TaxID=37332 RepID=A0ABC8AVM4_9NOCA|nr:LLM class flavin-dependent oxidoreductase [Nocardia seriolae]APA98060.1 Limonene 1,2-monooxygenase [Nocardia seriolae]OJF80029.1 luciferase [Nocardia seriolae]PSK27926.1 LLM class flavin-dependent oxidoreductase [Nocardia seriolae]QOW36033.1 LLM class flavin-dependent oxidoreductase [Nocardia seriolae]QUN16471.1 LLM class flavin-dependent oxidoreductase [Nocardia seriolae]